MSHWDFGRAPAGHRDEAICAEDDDLPYGPGEVSYLSDAPDWAQRARGDGDGANDDDRANGDDEDFGLYPITYERGLIEPGLSASRPDDATRDPGETQEIWPPAPVPDGLFAPGQWNDDPYNQRPWPPQPPWAPPAQRSWPARRALIAAGIALAAAIGGTAVFLSGSRPGGAAATGPATGPASAASAASPAPLTAPTAAGTPMAPGALPLTLAQARAVLAGYTSANNHANAQRSDTELATVETGSSYAIDAALYRMQRAAGAAPYPAYGPASAAYYIPRAEPAAGPRWFAVLVANAYASSPRKVSTVEYLLFLQAAPGAPWRNAIEPYLLPGASTPRIAVGADGLATAVAVTATSLTAAPVQFPALTARSLDGSGPLAIPAGTADRTDERSWQEKTPALAFTDRHAPATAGQAFALRTADGGALVFYTVADTMTITEGGGAVFRLNIPGLQSPAQPLRQAVLQFRDQFAAYDPPAGSGTPRIIAEYSGITRRM